MVRRESKSDAVRRAAAQVFVEKGFRDATIQDIADRLEIPKGSAYYHVGSKEGLFYEILVIGLTESCERVETIATYPISVLDRLRIITLESIRSSLEGIHQPVVVKRAEDIDALTPEHRTEYIELRDRYQRCIVGLIEEGVAKGEIRPLPNAKLAAFASLALWNDVLRWYRPDGALSINQIADVYWDFLRSALTGSPQPTAAK